MKWTLNILAETGVENIRWGIASSAVVEGNLLLFNVGANGAALDKETGKLVWSSAGKHSYATPVVFDHKGKRLAAIFSAPGLRIVDVNSGKQVADFDWETNYEINGADPMILNEKIFISSGYKRGCAMLDFSGKRLEKIWENDVLNTQFSSSVYFDGYIYGMDGNNRDKGSLRCIKAEDGTEQWSVKCGFGSLIAADGKLVVLTDRGKLFLVKVKRFPHWKN